jgi:hypothetical protein
MNRYWYERSEKYKKMYFLLHKIQVIEYGRLYNVRNFRRTAKYNDLFGS